MITIPVRIDNTGSNGSTVYSIQLDFHNNDKSHTTPSIPDITIKIPPHRTIKKDLSFTLTRRAMQLENELTNVKVIFNYTHGQKQIEIPNIEQTTHNFKHYFLHFELKFLFFSFIHTHKY